MIMERSVQKMKSYRTNRTTMNVAVYGVLLFFGFTQNSVDCTAWVDDLTKYVSESSEFKQVRIITQLDENEWFDSPVIDELFEKLIQTMPTLRINFDKHFTPPAQSVLDDTSATFFLLIIESRNGLPNSKTMTCLSAMFEMSKKHYAPKYLIASFVRTPSRDIEQVLYYAWEQKKLQLTIVELVEPELPRTSILIERPITVPRTYQLNPFKQELIEKNWTADVKSLYADKVTNMWGYPLKVAKHGDLLSQKHFKANDLVMDIIMKRLNCSKKQTAPFILRSWNGTEMVWYRVPGGGIHGADIMPDLHPIYNDFFKILTKTVPVITDKSHFLVPILSKSETVLSTNFLWACVLSFGIVFIFWTFTRLIGFDSQFWGMFNITWILFGFSVTDQPRGNAERIVFASLLAIFAFYSSELYSSLTEVTLQRTSEKKFETLDDLIDSQLELRVSDEDFERVRGVFVRVSANVSLSSANLRSCPPKMEELKNVSCLIGKMFADRYISMSMEEGRPTLKIAEPAMWSEIYTFPVATSSPYLPSLDKIIMELQSIGLIQKIYYDAIKLEKTNDVPVDPTDPDTLLRHVVYLGIIGFSLSFVVLIIEIIYHRISMYRKSKSLFGLFPIRDKIRPKQDEFSVLTDVKNIYKAFCKK